MKKVPMELVNLTGSYVILGDEYGRVTRVLKPDGEGAHVEGEDEIISNESGISIRRLHAQKIVGLPEPREGVLYVVSNQVARVTDREDVVTPEFTDAHMVDGNYVGVRRFLGIHSSQGRL